MYERILIPTDGSDVATAAAQTAVSLAEQFDATLNAVYVVEHEIYPSASEQETERGESALEDIESLASEAGVDVSTTLVDESKPVHRSIIDHAQEHGSDLIVMGTQGRTGMGRVLLGSVTEQTLRNSPIPVMTVHGESAIISTVSSILLPYDGSEGAQSAVDHALELAQTTGATVHVLNVVDQSVMASGEISAGMVLDALKESGERAVESVTEQAKEADVEAEPARVEVGSPFRTIVDYAEENEIDCIVMGTKGRSGISRVLLGSVTERVVRHSKVPVLTIRNRNNTE